MHRPNTAIFLLPLLLFGVSDALAQRQASPRGEASTQIGESWIFVDYGRPILRGRTNIFGSGEDYGTMVTGPAPVWRAGANKSTRFHTEISLMIGDTEVAPGEYSIFVDLSQNGWTFILSSHDAKDSGRAPGDGIWGAYGYSSDKDVLRVPMTASEMAHSADQFTIGFFDMTEAGGVLSMMWENTMASVPFTIVK